jgi:hypothetical protein
MLTQEQEVEASARELRKVAYHESAHKVLCERFGGTGHVELWRNDADRIHAGECAWRGRFYVAVFPWVANAERKAAGIKQVRDPVWSREYICMAGLLSEIMLDDLDSQAEHGSDDAENGWLYDAGFVADELRNRIEQGEASETDLSGMGVGTYENEGGEIEVMGWKNRLVLTGIRMVREEWPKIVIEAERLIESAKTEQNNQ